MMPRAVTHDGREWSNAAEDRVELVDHDPSWARQYETAVQEGDHEPKSI